jgi:hypothetical protein
MYLTLDAKLGILEPSRRDVVSTRDFWTYVPALALPGSFRVSYTRDTDARVYPDVADFVGIDIGHCDWRGECRRLEDLLARWDKVRRYLDCPDSVVLVLVVQPRWGLLWSSRTIRASHRWS